MDVYEMRLYVTQCMRALCQVPGFSRYWVDMVGRSQVHVHFVDTEQRETIFKITVSQVKDDG